MSFYILQLLEMEKKKILAMLISSLQATVASLLALLQLYGTLRENWKIGKFPSLTPNVFITELDILNLNLSSHISLYF